MTQCTAPLESVHELTTCTTHTQSLSNAAAASFDAEIAAVRAAVERVVLDLVTGPRSTPDMK